MNRKKLLALYGLKWDPFAQELPSEALWVTKRIEHFTWRMEQQVFQGGFALIAGEPGAGKSAALRLLAERLGEIRDVHVGVLTRPQSRIADFYREMGEVFGVKLKASNRWGGFKVLRDRWKSHVETTLMRPVLLIDEAQELPAETLSEIRLLQSAKFDSVSYLTVVLCGDGRLLSQLRLPDLLPVESRIRTRLTMEYASRDELLELLDHTLEKAGNRKLLTKEVMETMVDHCGGNVRSLMNTGNELLQAAMAAEASQVDEKLYLEVFAAPPPRTKKARRSR
jgi:type II secretory pathway predicted ATPase ExeA